LRSGRIAWQEGTDKGEPWNIHHLILYCSVDTRLWTAEATEQVCQEKAEDIAKTLTNMNEKANLNDNQQAYIRRNPINLSRLNNPSLPVRPPPPTPGATPPPPPPPPPLSPPLHPPLTHCRPASPLSTSLYQGSATNTRMFFPTSLPQSNYLIIY
jgi:hypothetical protein